MCVDISAVHEIVQITGNGARMETPPLICTGQWRPDLLQTGPVTDLRLMT